MMRTLRSWPIGQTSVLCTDGSCACDSADVSTACGDRCAKIRPKHTHRFRAWTEAVRVTVRLTLGRPLCKDQIQTNTLTDSVLAESLFRVPLALAHWRELRILTAGGKGATAASTSMDRRLRGTGDSWVVRAASSPTGE